MRLPTTLACAGFALAVAMPSPQHLQHPDLSGSWKLNAAQSDNPRERIERRDSAGEGPRGGPRGYPGMGGGRGGFGGGGFGGGFGGVSEAQRERMRQAMRLALDAPAALSISQTDSTVTFTPESGDTLVIASNGRKLRQKVAGGADIEIKGRWQGNDFVLERSVMGGGKVTEDYLRSQDGKRLFVIVSFEGWRGRNVTFRRVYDGAAAK